LVVVNAQDLDTEQPELKCFDEKHPSPTSAGGLPVIVNASSISTANRHPGM